MMGGGIHGGMGGHGGKNGGGRKDFENQSTDGGSSEMPSMPEGGFD